MHTKPTCDICGAACDYPASLLDIYQTAELKEVCPACEKWANDKKRELLAKNTMDLKTAIRARADHFLAMPPKQSWLAHIFSPARAEATALRAGSASAD